MLEHLRLRIVDMLASTRSATLATSGPAGLQARIFPCEAQGIAFYLLLPSTSDQLLNLEYEPTAVVSTVDWQLRGTGHIHSLESAPPELDLPRLPQAPGCVLVAIQPQRLQIHHRHGWGFSETIDIV